MCSHLRGSLVVVGSKVRMLVAWKNCTFMREQPLEQDWIIQDEGFRRMFKKFDEFHPMQNDMIPELDSSQFFRVILRRFFFCRA